MPVASGAASAYPRTGPVSAEIYTPDFRQHAAHPDGDADVLARYRTESAHADAVYIETLDLLEEVYRRKYASREETIERLANSAVTVIETARSSNSILRKAVRLKKNTCSLAEHSLNVAILAVRIGAVRGYNNERLMSLILCAFLGDIGMTLVDQKILAKSGKLSSGEVAEIKNHIRYSQEILASDFHEFPFLVPVAGQIHEREDGSGYPLGLKRDNIHEFAKIIGLCDVYIAMTSRKAHREDFSGYATLQQIISRRGIDFNAQIIKSLIDVISVFPLESLVKLNNGAIGRVIDISSLHPTRPKLNILISSDGERLNTPKYLDLEQEPLLYVETPDVEEGVVL
jgi:HD-GYP domain-containing protein (c-di-GMP phosphodiesterase class II)